jgi:beta-lactamase regulating signal transducer with metallopeptidase domain
MDLHLSQWSGAELIDVELKALLIFVLACCLAAMSRKAAASTRHAIWLAAIVLLITLPIAGLALPEFSLPLLPSTPIDVDGAVKATALDSKELSLPAAAWEATSGWVVALSLFVNAWSRFALVIWATGFFLLMVRAAVGLIRLDGLRRSAEAVDDAGWQTLLATAKIQAGVRRDVELMVSPGVRTPVTWGLQRIHICLPAHADQWSMMNRRIVLAHELAHARRGDWLWQLLSIAMTSLHWFNPLAWCSAHRMRMEAEIACDDEVIMRGCAPSAYADCLYQMVRAAKATPVPRIY